MDDVNIKKVLNHLLFHKSLIDEEDDGQRINRYLEMVENLECGMHIAIKNPFEKSIAMAFELVIEQGFNPWDIDLIKFSKMYLKRVKKEKIIDFVTAGKLIFMAWSILKMQSDRVLALAEPNKGEEGEAENMGEWDLLGVDELYQDPKDYDYATAVLKNPEPPLTEMVWRKNTRPVTLIELVDAFDEARKEAEIRAKINAIRAKIPRPMVDKNFGSKLHHETLEEDICITWKRILTFDGGKIPLNKICDGNIDDYVTTFIAILFLADHSIRRIRIRQKKFPYGEIMVQNIYKGKNDDDVSIGEPEIVTKKLAAA